jgi:UDP-N-acetylglucosamine--N-acetylmuramyl-(pentapeptide) pyrophosphoryl-undecaprenol N-acetylglucosamine transferase
MMKQKKKRLLVVGGGSGGHVTPLLSVIDELARDKETYEIRLWCDRRYLPQAQKLMTHAPLAVRCQKLFAGKFRRYHRLSFLEYVKDVGTLLHNVKDVIIICAGLFQALGRLLIWRPDVIFCKGGFVCLPAGYAAWMLGIPLIIHDSDTHPGLTNRLLAKKARRILTGAPLEYYSYSPQKARYVGIPVAKVFQPFSRKQKNEFKKKYNYNQDLPIIVITGGGLGAVRLNRAVVNEAHALHAQATIVHLTGGQDYENVCKNTQGLSHYFAKSFIEKSEEMAGLLATADVVVARAGATTMVELAACHAVAILVPNPHLTGGHQLKNAQMYADSQAAMIIHEQDLQHETEIISDTILNLLHDENKKHHLRHTISQFAKPHANEDIADEIRRVVGE